MDKITHEVRLAQWAEIIRNCQLRPQGQSIKKWLAEQGINEKTYYYWQRRVRKEVYDQSTSITPLAESKTDITFTEVPNEVLDTSSPDPTTNTSAAPDALIRLKNMEIEIRNSLSPSILKSILEVATRAR